MNINRRGGRTGFAPQDAAPQADKRVQAALKQGRQTGTCSLANLGLTVVPPDLLKLPELTFGEKWWELGDVTKLDLSHNVLSELPDGLKAISPQLSVLLLSYNRLTAVPESLGQIDSLKKLSLACNGLVSLHPGALAGLTALVDLELSSNKLTTIPEAALSGFERIEVLTLDNNLLVSLPQNIGALTGLKRLPLSKNRLRSLPDSICALRNLRELELDGNQLESLPADLWSLPLIRVDVRNNRLSSLPEFPPNSPTVLAQLYCSFNQLTTLHPTIAHATSLVEMDLANNRISSIPEQIADLRGIKLLDLSNNDLSNIPFIIGRMTSLTRLMLDGNPLRAVRPEVLAKGTLHLLAFLRSKINGPSPRRQNSRGSVSLESSQSSSSMNQLAGELRYLLLDASSSRTLQLDNRDLTGVPEAVYDVLELTRLDLSHNMIRSVDHHISRLRGLKEFNLGYNELTDLPSPITLPALTLLDVRKNRLTALPSVMELRSLQILHVSFNPLELPFDWLASVPTLTELYVSNCNLSRFPSDILTLGALSVLDLSNNRLLSVPPDITALTSLTSLQLTNNELRVIAPEVGLMTHLRNLALEGNPQRTLRQNILLKGTAAVLSFLRDRLPQPYP
mmetsp:Transcript_49702/g.82508  ORF Transcript_49702/g.82508 Transcript_49702/m.82508 type:complete len:622 (+) Transcript_49702:34-1899(+)